MMMMMMMMAFASLMRIGGGGRFDKTFLACALYFLKYRSPHAHQFHSLDQDLSTMAQQAQTVMAGFSLMRCVRAHFRQC